MVSVRQTARTTRALTAGAAALLMVVGLAACTSDGPGAANDPSDPGALETAGFATAWTELTTPSFLSEAEFVTGFSAGGEFWMLDRQNHARLNGTSDGIQWRQLDLTEHGLPSTAKIDTGGNQCGDRPVVRDEGTKVELVYADNYQGAHALSLVNRFYLVTIDGDVVTVDSAVELGLERMPAAQGELNYRTSCIAAVFGPGGRRVAVGSGQWWKPFATGGIDPFSAVEGADGLWTVHSIVSPADTPRESLPIDAAVEHAGTVVIAVASAEGVKVLSSDDGIDWSRQLLSAQGRAVGSVWMEAGEAGIVLIGQVHDGAVDGVDEYSYFAWFSGDAETWSEARLLADRSEHEVKVLTATTHGYYAVIRSRAPSTGGSAPKQLFHSTDGAEWEPLELDRAATLPLLGQVFEHEGELISYSIFSKVLTATGLPW